VVKKVFDLKWGLIMSKSAIDRLKSKLNYNQSNLSNGRVTAVDGSTVTVRLNDGTTRTAYAADDYSVDDLVSVSLSGTTASISGTANLETTASLKTVTI
jgi:hypothetical protein